MISLASFKQRWNSSALFRWVLSAAALAALFAIYVFGIWENPPGYYVDESALSYNAYLVSETGAGETGASFPLFFPVYTEPFTQYANPTQVYLLAILFKLTGPSIVAARLLAAGCVFLACVLMGLLAGRITGRGTIGAIVAALALTTPWMFEVGRIVLETFFYPLGVVFLLWSVFRVSGKKRWSWLDCFAVAASLAILTYSYTIGRLLGPLLAAGLLVFAAGRERLISVVTVWAIYFISLIPFLAYWYENPELARRFRTLSYAKPGSSAADFIGTFAARFAEDLNPVTMLLIGDINPRHHLPGALGSFFAGTFILSLAGIVLVIARRRRDRWWQYVVFGMLASLVPGALTVDAFHTLRMVAYPVFLLTLTIPALQWLLDRRGVDDLPAAPPDFGSIRLSAATAIISLMAAQAAFFYLQYHQTGMGRGEYFDASYKPVYEAAVSLPNRPIYLVDGYWGPAYIHAYWYATLEGRKTSEFVHLPYGSRPPVGSMVLSSEWYCRNCEIIRNEGAYLLYIEETRGH